MHVPIRPVVAWQPLLFPSKSFTVHPSFLPNPTCPCIPPLSTSPDWHGTVRYIHFLYDKKTTWTSTWFSLLCLSDLCCHWDKQTPWDVPTGFVFCFFIRSRFGGTLMKSQIQIIKRQVKNTALRFSDLKSTKKILFVSWPVASYTCFPHCRVTI